MLFCRCSISCSVILLNSAGFLSLIAEKQLANFSWLQKHRSKIELAWFYKVTGRIMQFWCKLLDFYFPLTFSRIIIPANFYLKLQIWNDCGWNALIGYNDFIRSVDNDKLPHDNHTFCISAHLPAAIILSKHFFITFLKSTMRLPSLSSCFSNDKLSFSDKEFDSKLSPIILAAILKLSALFSLPRSALSYLSITLVE